jgi:hypothetical protein
MAKQLKLCLFVCAGKRPIDVRKYALINIWKDENMKREE